MTDESHSTSTSPSKEFKWKNIFGDKVANLLDTVYIDVYVFIFAFSVCITHVTGGQLVQDKICLNDLKLAPNVCQNIQERTEYTKQAVYIYRRTTVFTTYAALIIFIPSTLITFLLGRWIDRYPHFTKYVLVAPLIGNMVYCATSIYQCIYFELDYMTLLYAKIPFGVLGGIGLFFSSTQTHITRKTLPGNRSIRFGMLDFCFRMGFVSSLSLGGFILVSIPWIGGQIRNYIGVYAISLGCCVFAFIWVLVVIKLDDFKNEPDKKDGESEVKESAFSSLFDPSNITSMWNTCFRKRKDGNHHKIRNLILCIVLTMIGSVGEATITFQFVQKVYRWNAEYYSNVKSLTALMPAIGGILTPFLLVHYLEMRDTTMAIIGSSAVILASAIKGGIMEPFAYFLGEGIGIFGILLGLSMRSVISRIARPDEVGQIFTILSCFHSMAPIVSAAFYTAIFNKTIEFYPGFVYHVVAVMKFYALFVAIWLDLKERRAANEEQKMKNESKSASFPDVNEMKEIQLKFSIDEKSNVNGLNKTT